MPSSGTRSSIPNRSAPDSTEEAADGLIDRPLLAVAGLAVAGVVLYDLQVRAVAGGYLGFDVGFVLAGYLATRRLLASHEAGISVVSFWVERTRRVLPPLLVMLTATAFLIRWLLLPTQWPRGLLELLAAGLAILNWQQIASTPAFGGQALISPLQHLWAVSLLDQFYIVWPAALLLLLRPRAPRPAITTVLAGIALSAVWMAALFATYGPTRAYIGTDARAQELLIGAALAMISDRPALRQLAATQGGQYVGPAALVVVVLAILVAAGRSDTYYFGGGTIFSLAVAALLWSVETFPATGAAWWLGRSPLVLLGRISYGLFLWHWPVIVLLPLAAPVLFGDPGLRVAHDAALTGCWEAVVSVVLAGMSYALIEKPVWAGRLADRLTPRRVLAAAPSALVATLVVGSIALALPLTAPPPVVVEHAPVRNCTSAYVCVLRSAKGSRPVVTLAGDSTAKAMLPALLEYAGTNNWTLYDATQPGCSLVQRWVVTDPQTAGTAAWQRCYDLAPKAQDAIAGTTARLIVVSDQTLMSSSLDDSGRVLLSGTPEHLADIEGRVAATARRLTSSGGQLILLHLLPPGLPLACGVRPPPELPDCGVKASDDRLLPLYNHLLDQVAAANPSAVKTVDLTGALCPDDRCPPRMGDTWIRTQDDYLTWEGARWIEPALAQRLNAIGVPANG